VIGTEGEVVYERQKTIWDDAAERYKDWNNLVQTPATSEASKEQRIWRDDARNFHVVHLNRDY
jgi:hypothetical protein